MKSPFLFFVLFSQSLLLHGQSFYDLNSIQTIEITFLQPNWDYMMDTAKAGKEGYILAQQVKINGQTYDSAGVKYKGNSSYKPSNKKNPLHIALDEFREQNHQGFTDIKLGNHYSDPSMIREVLAYDLLGNYMDCPRSNFARVYINGVYYGLYANTESINKRFYGDHFYSKKNAAVKCNPLITPGTNAKCNLKHLGNDSAAYYNYYELKSDGGWKDLVRLADSVTNSPGSLERNMDLDRVLWMLAYNNALVNLDSYLGAFCQNYYLYKDDNGRFVPVIWDLNMCFGGFPHIGAGNNIMGSLSISGLQQLSMSSHSTDPYWPVIVAVFSNSTWKRMYHAHLKTIVNEMIASGSYTTRAVQMQTLIDNAVLADTCKVYSYTQFQNGLTANVSVGSYSVPGIQTLMSGRNSYLQSRPEFTAAAPLISSVSSPTNVIIGNPVTITASVTNAGYCYLGYRTVSSRPFSKIQMYDDGLHDDGAAGDNTFGASFTFNSNQAEYYVYAENNDAGAFSPARAEHEFYLLKRYATPQAGDVTINEFLAENTDDVRNELNRHEDWIELYNNSNVPLSLSNFYLSDENDRRTKYAFPHQTVIQPKSYLIVWADGLQGTQLHANFKLDNDGDKIILSNGAGLLLDSVIFGSQSANVSSARCPNGTGPFAALKYPTYASANCVVGADEHRKGINRLLIFPNPASEKVWVSLPENGNGIIEVYNIMGQKVYAAALTETMEIETEGWSNGIYIISVNGSTKKLIINHK